MTAKGLDSSKEVPPNPGVIDFCSGLLSCQFCIDDACLRILPEVLKNDSAGILNSDCSSFTLIIEGKNYKFPNDKRVINGIHNRIIEILKKNDKSEHKTNETD